MLENKLLAFGDYAIEMYINPMYGDGEFGEVIHVNKPQFILFTLENFINQNQGKTAYICLSYENGNKVHLFKSKRGDLIDCTENVRQS